MGSKLQTACVDIFGYVVRALLLHWGKRCGTEGKIRIGLRAATVSGAVRGIGNTRWGKKDLRESTNVELLRRISPGLQHYRAWSLLLWSLAPLSTERSKSTRYRMANLLAQTRCSAIFLLLMRREQPRLPLEVGESEIARRDTHCLKPD